MDLDSRAYSKLICEHNTHGGSEEYVRIVEALCLLGDRYDHETPEMWCSRIRDPFRKILNENPRFLSRNGYISMYGNLYESGHVHGYPTNYIYCSICDSLVFIPENGLNRANCYRNNHFKSCISGNSISIEHARRKDILKSIDNREFVIWQYKQYILQEEAKIKRLQLELASQSQSLSHSKKDKLASVSYDSDSHLFSYETYMQVKATIAKNTMPACISSARQEIVLPISYHVLNQKSEALNGPTPPLLPQKPVELVGGLERYPCNIVQVHLRLEIFGMIDQIYLIFLAGLL